MDRKAAIRQYKESRRPMGVWRIRNSVSGKSLIGACTELPAMLNRTRAQLKLGAHGNKALQKDWNELGADAFEIESLDTLTPPDEPDYDPQADLKALEELWLEKLALGPDQAYDPRQARR